MNKKIIALLVLMAFIFSGCGKKADTTTKDSASPYLGGDKGLLAEFEPMGVMSDKTKKQEVFEGEPFSIVIDLKNKGEYEMAPGDANVALLGIKLTDFTEIVAGGTLNNTEAIDKISDFNAEGGQTSLDFTPSGGAVYGVALTGESYDVNVFARVDYRYKTFVSVPQVCYKEDLADTTVCTIDESKQVFSSGAPVQIKKADEKRAGPGKVAIEFDVENVGSGSVAKIGEDFDARFDELSFAVSDPAEWDCKSSGRDSVRLDNSNKAKIQCKLRTAIPEGTLPYTKQLDMTLEYRYREHITSTIRVNKQ